ERLLDKRTRRGRCDKGRKLRHERLRVRDLEAIRLRRRIRTCLLCGGYRVEPEDEVAGEKDERRTRRAGNKQERPGDEESCSIHPPRRFAFALWQDVAHTTWVRSASPTAVAYWSDMRLSIGGMPREKSPKRAQMSPRTAGACTRLAMYSGNPCKL